MEIHGPVWSYGKSKLLHSTKGSGLLALWVYGKNVIIHWGSAPGKMTPWLVTSVLAGIPNTPSIKEAGEPLIEKVNEKLVPSLSMIKKAGKPAIEKVSRQLVPGIVGIKGSV